MHQHRYRRALLVAALGLVLVLMGTGLAFVSSVRNTDAQVTVTAQVFEGGRWVTVGRGTTTGDRPVHMSGTLKLAAWSWGGCGGTPSGRGYCGGGPFRISTYVHWCTWPFGCYGGVNYIQDADTMWGYGLVLPQATAQYYDHCDRCAPGKRSDIWGPHGYDNHIHISNDCRPNGVCINDQYYIDNWTFTVGRFFQPDSHPRMWGALDIYQDGAFYYDGGCSLSC